MKSYTVGKVVFFLILFQAISGSLSAQIDPDASYVEISYEGPVDSFSQSGPLQHDGSIGSDIPIHVTVKLEEPDFENLTINESSTSRSYSILASIEFRFGNYSFTETKPARFVQFVNSDWVNLSIVRQPTEENSSGEFFVGNDSIALSELESYGLFSISFLGQGATLENVWDRLVRGEMGRVSINVNWSLAGSPFEERIFTEVYAGKGFGPNQFPGEPFKKTGFQMKAVGESFGFLEVSTTGGVPVDLINVTPTTFSGFYPKDQVVELTLSDWKGITFTGWSGVSDKSGTSILETIDGHTAVTANFEPDNAFANLNISELGDARGNFFSELVWDPIDKRLFASLFNDDRTTGSFGPVVELDPTTGKELAWIDIRARIIRVTPNGRELWVVDDNAKLFIIDLSGESGFNSELTQSLETLAGNPPRFYNLFMSAYGDAVFVSGNGFSNSANSNIFQIFDVHSKEKKADVLIEPLGDDVFELWPYGGMISKTGNRLWIPHNFYYLGGGDTSFSMELNPENESYGIPVEVNTSNILQTVRFVLENEEEETLFQIGKRRDRLDDNPYLERVGYNGNDSKLLYTFSPKSIITPEQIEDTMLLFQAYGNSLDKSKVGEEDAMEIVIFDLEDEVVSHRISTLIGPNAEWTKAEPGYFFVHDFNRLLRIDYSSPEFASLSVESDWAVPGVGGIIEIPVTASNQAHWQGLTTESWITVQDDWKLYTGSDSLIVEVDRNPSEEVREGKIYIYGNPVTIRQPASGSFVNLSHNTYTSTAGGGSTLIEISSNAEWLANTESKWVEIVSETSGTGSGWLTVYVKPNYTDQERQATVTVNEAAFVVTQAAGPAEIVRTPTGGSSDFTAGVHEVTIRGRPAVILVGENYDPATPTYLAYYLHGDEGGYDWWTSPSSPIAQLINEKGWVYVAPLAPQTGDNYQWENNRESNLQLVEEVLDFMFSNFNVYREHVFGAGASGGSFFHDAFFFPTKGQQYPSYFALTCGASGMAEGGTNYSAVESASNDELFLSRSELHYAIGTEDFLFPPALISLETYSELGYSVSADVLEGVGHCDFSLDSKIAEYWHRKASQLDELFGDTVLGVLEVAEGQWSPNPDTIGWLYGSKGSADMYAYSTQLGNIYHADFPWIYDFEWGWILFLSREGDTSPVHYYHGDLGHLTIFDESATGWFYSWNLNAYDNFVSPAGLIPLP